MKREMGDLRELEKEEKWKREIGEQTKKTIETEKNERNGERMKQEVW